MTGSKGCVSLEVDMKLKGLDGTGVGMAGDLLESDGTGSVS